MESYEDLKNLPLKEQVEIMLKYYKNRIQPRLKSTARGVSLLKKEPSGEEEINYLYWMYHGEHTILKQEWHFFEMYLRPFLENIISGE